MIYAALRVSTTQQDVKNQKHGILDYANQQGFSNIEFVEDTASGKVHWRDRKFGEMLAQAEEGDVILFAEVSRIGRSTLQVLEFMKAAAEKGVKIHVVKERIIADESMQSEIMITLLGMFAQIERQFISTRTKEALSKRKADGVQLGRPKGKQQAVLQLDRHPGKKQVAEWVDKGIGMSAIAKLCDCSRNTLRHYCEVREIDLPKAKPRTRIRTQQAETGG